MVTMFQLPLNKILVQKSGTQYICLENTVGHRWYFPYTNTRAYMSLYQPSSLKGTIVALTLPYLKHLKFLLRYINASIVKLQFDDAFIKTIETAFGKKDITCAIFCGSPGKHQKPTILLLSGSQYIGYCKISDNQEIINLFKEERKSLDYLDNMGVKHIPSIVYCAPLENESETWIMLQTTERKRKIRIALPTDARVMQFIWQMTDCTKKKMVYVHSDFSIAMHNLKHLLPLLKNKSQELFISKNIEEVETKLKSGEHFYSACHGDLTPWNSFVVNNHLFAFDFEYFKKTYPLYADFFHFFTQTQIYNNCTNVEQIVSAFHKIKLTTLDDDLNPIFLYKCYILEIMEFYLNRDKGMLNDRIEQIFGIWIKILTYVNNEKERILE